MTKNDIKILESNFNPLIHTPNQKERKVKNALKTLVAKLVSTNNNDDIEHSHPEMQKLEIQSQSPNQSPT